MGRPKKPPEVGDIVRRDGYKYKIIQIMDDGSCVLTRIGKE